MDLASLEKAVLDMMLERPNMYCEIIRQQITVSKIARRKFTGAGFFTYFIVPPNITAKCDLPDMELNGVGAEFPNLLNGAGFVLFIRNGFINFLEGFTYDENWPDKTDDFKLFKT